jgi:BNR/Asp-box repeat
MNVNLRSASILLAATLVPAALATPDAGPPPRIVVGPNILVSRDGDVAHCETMIAASPTDPKNLIGGSITMTRPDGSPANKAYVSVDGGSTWTDVAFPEEIEHGGGDPQVGFGTTGTAFFMGLSNAMNFYRSEDGGKTWSKALSLGKHGDHEMLITDHTTGPFAGRVYVADETDQKGSNELEDLVMKRRVVLFRSMDDGRTFIGPVDVGLGEGKGLAAYNLLVLSDGTLVVPMSEYPNYAVEKDASTWRAVLALSTDGGVTFSPRKPIAEINFGGLKKLREQQKSGRIDQIGGPVFAADISPKFRDRIYAAWMDLDGDRFQLKLSHSSDRGGTWSKPRPVDPGAPATSSQFQPMIAVNSDGILGVFFYSTEGFPDRKKFDVYFTASLDGGDTFLPKVRVSSESSSPFGAGNLRPGPIAQKDRGLAVIYTLSGLSRWPDGGDYIGLTADGAGAFHPFWTDGRSGTYQLYSAAIRVESEPAKKTPPVEKAVVSDKVALVFDPVRWDAQTREMVLPVRLKNDSSQPLYPPFTVEVKEVAHPYTVKSGEPSNAPTFLNSANGKQGVGATFDYSKAIGGLTSLEPGGITDAIPWRLQATSAVKTDFYLGTEITGFVAKGGGK